MTFEELRLDLIPVDDEVRTCLHDSSSGEVSPFNARMPAFEDIERLAAAVERAEGRRDDPQPAHFPPTLSPP